VAGRAQFVTGPRPQGAVGRAPIRPGLVRHPVEHGGQRGSCGFLGSPSVGCAAILCTTAGGSRTCSGAPLSRRTGEETAKTTPRRDRVFTPLAARRAMGCSFTVAAQREGCAPGPRPSRSGASALARSDPGLLAKSDPPNRGKRPCGRDNARDSRQRPAARSRELARLRRGPAFGVDEIAGLVSCPGARPVLRLGHSERANLGHFSRAPRERTVRGHKYVPLLFSSGGGPRGHAGPCFVARP
jgi:hypothetical protein